MRRRLLTFLVAAAVLVVVVGGFVAVLLALRPGEVVVASCTATHAGKPYTMDPEQAQNAAVVASVAEQRGLPDRAITIALAVAQQESRLRNLDHGDRDSVGLFQQRPSQGWGTAEQIMDPRYAAGQFYDHLVKVTGWQSLPLTVAAQTVQRSGTPTAYAQWEPRGTALMKALTGETPTGLTCHYPKSDIAVPPSGLTATLAADAQHDLGQPVIGTNLTATRGWCAVGWLMAHAADYQIAQVSYLGQTWDARSGKWKAGASTTQEQIAVTRTPSKA